LRLGAHRTDGGRHVEALNAVLVALSGKAAPDFAPQFLSGLWGQQERAGGSQQEANSGASDRGSNPTIGSAPLETHCLKQRITIEILQVFQRQHGGLSNLRIASCVLNWPAAIEQTDQRGHHRQAGKHLKQTADPYDAKPQGDGETETSACGDRQVWVLVNLPGEDGGKSARRGR
jgi:hypothetical protein